MHTYLGVSGEGCGLLTGGELLHAGDFCCKSGHGRERIPYFFTYKPSDFFSIRDKSLVDFSREKGVRLIAEGLGFKTNTIAE